MFILFVLVILSMTICVYVLHIISGPYIYSLTCLYLLFLPNTRAKDVD